MRSTSALGVVIRPPSPKQGRFLVGKNEKVAASPSAPQRTPSSEAPYACAASSSNARSCLTQISRERAHRGRMPEQVDGHDRAGARRDGGLDGGGIEAVRLVLDVGEHRDRADGCDRLGGRVEGERGADDLVAGLDPERTQRDEQRIRAVCDADSVGRAHLLGEDALDLGHARPQDETAGFDDIADRAKDLLAYGAVLRMGVHQGHGHAPTVATALLAGVGEPLAG